MFGIFYLSLKVVHNIPFNYPFYTQGFRNIRNMVWIASIPDLWTLVWLNRTLSSCTNVVMAGLLNIHHTNTHNFLLHAQHILWNKQIRLLRVFLWSCYKLVMDSCDNLRVFSSIRLQLCSLHLQCAWPIKCGHYVIWIFKTTEDFIASKLQYALKIWHSFVVRRLVIQSVFSARVNSLWPSDAIWRQGSGSTLAQVMACCLTAPSHYLNQCWLIISEVQWHSY